MQGPFKLHSKPPKYRTILQSFYHSVKLMDKFGIPVSLTYKNDPHLKSFAGGLVTLLARLGVLAFLLLQCVQVFSRASIIQSSAYRREMTKDATSYDLTIKDFDYAFRVEYIFFKKEPEIQANLD